MNNKILFFLLQISFFASAEDMIVLRNGSIIKAIVSEIGVSEIRYKKITNPTGPIYSIDKSDVLSINFENGEVEKFDRLSETGGLKANIVSSDNSGLIDKYNVFYSPNLNYINPQKRTKDVFFVLHLDSASVLSTSDIEIELNKSMDYDKNGGREANNGDTYINDCLGDRPMNYVGWFEDQGVYQIVFKNKSSNTLYIDLGNSFRVENGNPMCYYDGTEIRTLSNSNSSGIGIGLGAITNAIGIGGTIGSISNGLSAGMQSGNGNSTTYLKERIFVIPPYSTRVLNEPKWIKIHGTTLFSHGKYENVGGHYEYPTNGFIMLDEKPLKGQVQTYNYSDSPFVRQYYFTYSKSENFESYYILNYNLFLAQIIGAEKSWESILNTNEYTIGGIVNYRFKY